MLAPQRFIRCKTILALTLCAAIGVASNTYAGFEWIPQKKAQPAPMAEPPYNQPVASEPVPVDDVVLPLPSQEALDEPVIVEPPQPVMQKKAAESTMPTRLTITPKEQPNSGVIVNTPAEPSLPPLDLEEPAMQPLPAAEENPEMLKKPPMDRSQMNIIVPDDAPHSALESIQNKTTIDPFPSEQDLAVTNSIAMPSVDGGVVVISEDSMGTTPVVVSPEFAEAVGFAKDVPLALALRQVVPADYAFSFEEGVNPGLRVSWNGGKPWNDVVADMAVSLGYGVVITRKSVRITKQQQSKAIPLPATIEPAAGNQEADEVTTKIDRARNIKRVAISDPGIEEPSAKTVASDTIIIEQAPETKNEQATASEDDQVVTSISINDNASKTPQKISFWTAEAGSSLKETLAQWSQSEQVDLVWNASHDFLLPADFEVRGSFEKAVDLLLKHGLEGQNASLSHTLATGIQNNQVQIIIQNAA